MLQIPVQILEHGRGLPMPVQASEDAAGMDLRAAIYEPLALRPGERKLIPTGISLAIPQGYEGQVRPRSGLAVKHGLTVLNTPGTIDADYRGELRVCLINLGQEAVAIERGDRIAQLLIAPVSRAALFEVDALETTARGARGFGSTGVA